MALDRDVAIKVLPPLFTMDAARLARFEREARLLATLNHPHIGAITHYDVTGDGQKLLLREAADDSRPSIRVIVNWMQHS